MTSTIVAFECPWREWNQPDRHARFSMRPYLEGVCDFHDARLIYRTFTTRAELNSLIRSEAFDGRGDRTLLYISTHASGSRLTPSASSNASGINVKNIATAIKASNLRAQGLDGVWLSACELGMGNALSPFVHKAGALPFAFGYACEINWDAASRIDVAFLTEWLRARRPTKRFPQVVRAMTSALKAFNPDWVVGTRGDERVALRDAVRIWGHEIRQKGRSGDLTSDVTETLGWTRPPPAAPLDRLSVPAHSVLRGLKAQDKPLSRADIIAVTGLAESSWAPAVKELRKANLIATVGAGPAAKYKAHT